MKELAMYYLIVIAILTVIGFTGYNAFKKQIIQPLEEVNSQIQSMTVVK